MADTVDVTSGFEKLDLNSSSSDLSFEETFVWDWYIRLKVRFPVNTDAELSTNLEDISKEFDGLWQGSFTITTHSLTHY
jgi:hypothetical protein